MTLTITADDGTALEVTAIFTDPPDRAVGLLDWQYDVTAARALTVAEQWAVWRAIKEWKP